MLLAHLLELSHLRLIELLDRFLCDSLVLGQHLMCLGQLGLTRLQLCIERLYNLSVARFCSLDES